MNKNNEYKEVHRLMPASLLLSHSHRCRPNYVLFVRANQNAIKDLIYLLADDLNLRTSYLTQVYKAILGS